MKKGDLIREFQERFSITEIEWNKFLSEVEVGTPLKEVTDKFNVNYNATRYLFYSLGFDISSKIKRKDSILNLQKDLAKENNENFDVVEELEDELQSLADKNRKLYKSLTLARDEANSLRRETRQEIREEYIIENIYQIAETTIHKSIDKVKTLELPKIQYVREGVKREGQAFMLLSDLHYNEVVNPRFIEGYNQFNNQVCLEGIDKIFKEVVRFNTSTLKIYLAGDLLAGKIYHLDKKGQVPLTESVVELATFLASRINEISSLYDKVEVVMLNGNHSRLYDRAVSDLKAFDFEHLLYAIMKAQITATNVKSHYSLSGYAVDNIGTEDSPKYVGIHHLDMKRFNATSNTDILKQMEIFDELFKVRVVSLMGGHQHTPVFTVTNRGGNVFVNGCLSGSNEYGLNNDFLPLQPYQWIGVWNREGYSEEQKCIRVR